MHLSNSSPSQNNSTKRLSDASLKLDILARKSCDVFDGTGFSSDKFFLLICSQKKLKKFDLVLVRCLHSLKLSGVEEDRRERFKEILESFF